MYYILYIYIYIYILYIYIYIFILLFIPIGNNTQSKLSATSSHLFPCDLGTHSVSLLICLWFVGHNSQLLG